MTSTTKLYSTVRKDGVVQHELMRGGYRVLRSSTTIDDSHLFNDAITIWPANMGMGMDEYAKSMLDFYGKLKKNRTVEAYERVPEMQVLYHIEVKPQPSDENKDSQKAKPVLRMVETTLPEELLLDKSITSEIPELGDPLVIDTNFNLRTPYGNIKTIWPSEGYFKRGLSFDLPENPVLMAFRSGLYVPDELADLIVSTALKGVSKEDVRKALDKIYSFGADD